MSDQLILDFPEKKIYLKEDFYVSSSNSEVYNFVSGWPKWIKRIINIFGPSGSGKTHLLSILKKKTSTIEIDAKKLSENIFFKYKTKEVLILENLNEKISENLLFELWNTTIQDNKYLVITSKKPISTLKFNLIDLKSRIDSCLYLGIKLPNDDLISVILSKNFSDRQIKVDKKHVDYIIKRIDRSYEKISHFISILDKYSLKKGTPFSLKLIKEVLKMI
tara:strand:+ start:8843 stop:9502 length:660 start_codon:yes stop_codon:yes gene_type:complete